MPRPPGPSRPLTLKPAILAPAGGRAQLEPAVWAGADAVYFGLDAGLNAGARATGFGIQELFTTMDHLHERGVRGYLPRNALVYDEEFEKADHALRRIYRSVRLYVTPLKLQDTVF